MSSRHLHSCLALAMLLIGVRADAQDVFQPIPSEANPYVGHGGTAYGRTRSLNDLELTVITRATEQLEIQMAALAKARSDLVAASLSATPNPATITARAQAVAAAESTLAAARADAFARLKTQMRFTTAEKIVALANMLNTPGGLPTGGGGGGAAARLTAETILPAGAR